MKEISEAERIADVIAKKENGCGKPGASGETGCLQFMPSTWEAYSTEVLGHVAQQTEENERVVAVGMIERWLSEGKTPRDIFLIWNQGHDGPCSAGVNRYGVSYDSCLYVDEALALLS